MIVILIYLNHIGKWVYIYQTITINNNYILDVSIRIIPLSEMSSILKSRIYTCFLCRMTKNVEKNLKHVETTCHIVISSYRLTISHICPLLLVILTQVFNITKRQPVDSPPCKGDKIEIEIFEAKRQNAGICGTCQKVFARWTFISIGRRMTQVQNCAFRLHGESILFFEC